MQEPLKALHAVVPAHQGEELQGVQGDDGAAHQLVEQHDLRRRRRQHRLLPRQLHSEARRRSSTGPSRWTAAIPRPSGTACMSVDETPEPAEPGERLALQHQQLAVVGGRRRTARRRRTIPAYVDRGIEESPRGFHALRVLDKKKDFTLDSLIAAAYDSYLPAFDVLMPRLLKAYDARAGVESAEGEAGGADRGAARLGLSLVGTTSVPTALAVYWGEELGRRVGDEARKAGVTADRLHDEQRDRRASSCRRSPPRPTSSPPTSASGRRRGATSTASSA